MPEQESTAVQTINHFINWLSANVEEVTDIKKVSKSDVYYAIDMLAKLTPEHEEESPPERDYWVGVEKMYYKDNGSRLSMNGSMKRRASSPDEALSQVEALMLEVKLQTCDERIFWESDLPGGTWDYEDYSFDTTGKVCSEKPEDHKFQH